MVFISFIYKLEKFNVSKPKKIEDKALPELEHKADGWGAEASEQVKHRPGEKVSR